MWIFFTQLVETFGRLFYPTSGHTGREFVHLRTRERERLSGKVREGGILSGNLSLPQQRNDGSNFREKSF